MLLMAESFQVTSGHVLDSQGCYPDYSNNMLQCPHASSHIVWAWGCNVALQVAYSLECVARLYVERSLFLQNRWNLIDLFIVL